MIGTWEVGQRQALLAQFAQIEAQREALLWKGGDSAELDTLTAQLGALWDAYAAAVPRVALARCPFRNEIVTHSVDDAGLDGLWWRHESPVRPDESPPPTLIALTGALRLAPPVEYTRFLVRPGPGAPYVLPDLLRRQSVRAVLFSFPVGRHTAYTVAYFGELPGLALPRPNEWGLDHFKLVDRQGRRRWDSADPDSELRDFDLRPWLDAGKLLWIAPDDATLTLRRSGSDCPYVNLPGERREQYVQFGEVTLW